MTTAQLSITGLGCHHGAHEVLRDITLDIARGEVVSSIGPSGSGKSTLLRTLVGLKTPSSGTVRLDGARVDYASRKSLDAARERMAIVCRQYNLFQNMNVLRNVTIAPVMIRRRPRAESTALIVSREMAFVPEVSDRVVIMDRGEIVETGDPATLFDAPRTDRACAFVGKILRH